MTLGDIVIGLCVLFCLFVGICALLLCVVGFSFGQGVAITLAFLFFGVWNPVGWAVLIWCIFSRRAQVKRALLERRRCHTPGGEIALVHCVSPEGRGDRTMKTLFTVGCHPALGAVLTRPHQDSVHHEVNAAPR